MPLGKIFIVLGLFIVGLGIILSLRGSIPFLGKLPGDFSFKGENYQIYIPIASSILVSIILSFLFYLFSKK